MGKYFYTKEVNYKTLKHVDIAGLINDATVLVDFSHVKGHGSCGFGGACKKHSDGLRDRPHAPTRYTRWRAAWYGIRTSAYTASCAYLPAITTPTRSRPTARTASTRVNYHHCTMCQHCLKVCPKHAITLDSHDYADFQSGMALTTKTVLDTFAPNSVVLHKRADDDNRAVRLLGHDHAVAGAGYRHKGRLTTSWR